jgi:5-methyltetrahydrofolate--homocysteine methyltransferase
MNDAVRYLGAEFAPSAISVLPNAGLPQNVGGRAVYKLHRRNWPSITNSSCTDYGVRIVGGCCGTTPEHMKAVVDAVTGVEPAKRDVKASGRGFERVLHRCRSIWSRSP